VLWKTSCSILLPKEVIQSGLNNVKPVALTSHDMKVLERLLLAHLGQQVICDPRHFAYQPDMGVDDAVIYLLLTLTWLAEAEVALCFYFSSAFNTFQPVLLSEKLLRMDVSASSVSWVADYLTDRPQFVWLGSTPLLWLVT